MNTGRVRTHPFVIDEIACSNLKRRQTVLSLLRNLPNVGISTDDEGLFFIERHRPRRRPFADCRGIERSGQALDAGQAIACGCGDVGHDRLNARGLDVIANPANRIFVNATSGRSTACWLVKRDAKGGIRKTAIVASMLMMSKRSCSHILPPDTPLQPHATIPIPPPQHEQRPKHPCISWNKHP